jgi:hypothetical protein
MFTPTRRSLIGATAGGLLLPSGLRATTVSSPTPLIPPFTREAATVRDARIGSGLSVNGRAILPLGAGSKRVWLDTKAAAGGNGRSHATAYKRETDAYAALLGGDQLMIASDSVLTVPLGQIRGLSGRSAVFPTVVQSYDRSAPNDAGRHGLLSNRVSYRGATTFLGSTGSMVSYFALRGIRLDHAAAKSRLAYAFSAGVNWLLIEQCAFIAAQLGLNAIVPTTAHVIRETSFQGQWSGTSHAQGLYTSANYDTVIEDCIFHHCGWRMGVTRSATAAAGGPTIFNHAIYAAVHSGGIVRRCVFVEPSSHGAQLRGNWHSHDNVFIACPLALLHGGGTTYAFDAPGGVMALSYRNVITTAQDISPTSVRGFGIQVANTRQGSVVEQTLAVGPGAGHTYAAFAASAATGLGYEPNPTRIVFQRNTNDWSAQGYKQGPDFASGWPNRVFLTDRNNIVTTDRRVYTNAARDGLWAAQTLGFASISELGFGMVADPGRSWAITIANYIRRGFAPRDIRLTPGVVYNGAVLPDGSWNAG